ncbi:peptidoglycan-binding domain-containing protein [Vannielia litorea]|uniref:Putative peptidoglycan binding domain-containing protein n=1 Tax=Vannielia litorea TaxID=1217970 RepID=A0A1N6EHX0_9RHOB|nr:peptidoglycan-binding domain-containing protein [Vannielia litorea]SIN82561.1 Putative peptidoglycan binding domain-containing protein [Vannielia litorea]
MTRQTTQRRPLGAALACGVLVLSACVQPPEVQKLSAPAAILTTTEAPTGATPGTCWGKETTPPETRTVIEPVLVQPAQIASDGTVMNPPIYRREPQQYITKPASHRWFETPCAADMTPEYIASVQRALAARGVYQSAATGEMDAKTRRAIRKFQAPQGLDSETLSLAAARTLGLAPALLPQDETAPEG